MTWQPELAGRDVEDTITYFKYDHILYHDKNLDKKISAKHHSDKVK